MQFTQSLKTGIIIAVLSLFAQTLNWVAFEKIGYDAKFTLLTPLILCFMYHLVQLDAGSKEFNFSRRFFFGFSVALPFAAGLILTIVMLVLDPGISTFNPDADYTGTAPEIIATYAGRFMLTSLYMAVFALIDIPILKYLDRKREEK
ncbi:MAG: hypothetical protein IJX77_00755 [Ruminococcus sp.]|nr:hypothetical protein [Ruminococcus sp.]